MGLYNKLTSGGGGSTDSGSGSSGSSNDSGAWSNFNHEPQPALPSDSADDSSSVESPTTDSSSDSGDWSGHNHEPQPAFPSRNSTGSQSSESDNDSISDTGGTANSGGSSNSDSGVTSESESSDWSGHHHDPQPAVSSDSSGSSRTEDSASTTSQNTPTDSSNEPSDNTDRGKKQSTKDDFGNPETTDANGAKIVETLSSNPSELPEGRAQALAETYARQYRGQQVAIAPNPVTQGTRILVGEQAGEVADIMAASQIEENIERTTGAEVQRGEDYTIEETESGAPDVEVTDEFKQEQNQRRQQTAAENVRKELERKTGLTPQRGEDFRVNQTNSGIQTELTPGFRREVAAQRIDEQISSLSVDPTDVERVKREGERIFQLDDSAQEMVRTRAAAGAIGGTTASQRQAVRLNDPALDARILIGGVPEKATSGKPEQVASTSTAGGSSSDATLTKDDEGESSGPIDNEGSGRTGSERRDEYLTGSYSPGTTDVSDTQSAEKASEAYDYVSDRYAGGLDVLAGSTDEAVGRAIQSAKDGDIAGVADALAGSSDEAVARAVDSLKSGDVAGAADAAAGGLDEATGRILSTTGGFADMAAGSVDEAVARTFDDKKGGGIGDYQTWASAGDELAGKADEAVARAARELKQGDLAGAADEAAGNLDEGAGRIVDALAKDRGAGEDLIQAAIGVAEGDAGKVAAGIGGAAAAGYAETADVADVLAGSTDEFVANANLDKQVTEAVTGEAGFLSEADERKLARAAQNFSGDAETLVDYATDYSPLPVADDVMLESAQNAGIPTSVTVAGTEIMGLRNEQGEGPAERIAEGTAEGLIGIGNVFGIAKGAESGVEIAANTPQAVEEYGAGAVGITATAVGREIAESAAQSARENPFNTAGSLASELVVGAIAGKATGKFGRMARDRLRTVGGDRVEMEDITQRSVREGDERFPGADNPERYKEDPAGQVREQAERRTPGPVEEFFRKQGVAEGVVLKKALDVIPEGPGRGRGGFTSAPDETGIDPEDVTPEQTLSKEAGEFAYENPGAFLSTEVSPYFFGAEIGSVGFSLRPGLPKFGNSPTGVLAKVGVRKPDADTQPEFAKEMARREGETTARTKPTGSEQLNPGEIESVVPPGATFEPVRSGGFLQGMARRFGVGSEFYTEVNGRRVPLRPVAPDDPDRPDTPDSSPDVDSPDSSSGSGERLDYYVREPTQAVDRPLPVPVDFGGDTGQAQGGQQYQTRPADSFASIEQDIQDLFGGGRRVTSDDRGRTTRLESQGDSGRSSGPADGRYVPEDSELPGDWRRKKPDEYDRRTSSKDRSGRNRDRSSWSRNYQESDRRGYSEPERRQTSYTEESGGSSRITESESRITSESGEGIGSESLS